MIEMLQLAPAATGAPHVFVALKSPVLEMLVTDRGAVPEFVTVTACAALTVPTGWLPKAMLVRERVTAGAPVGRFTLTVPRAKSDVNPADLVKLKTIDVMLGPVWSLTPMYAGPPATPLRTIKEPRDVAPLNASICAVNAPGPSA